MKQLLPIAVLLSIVSPVFAQTYELTSGQYTHFPGGFVGNGIPGCLPNAFQCDFALEGSVTLEIITVDLSRTGTPDLFDLAIFDDENLIYIGNPSVTVQPVAVPDIFVGDQPGTALDAQITFEGDEIDVFASYPISDGIGFRYDFTATLVPEPNVSWVALLVALLAARIRTHKHS